MFDLEKFRTGNYYVHLPTQELYDEAMKFLSDNGFVWGGSRDSLDSEHYWSKHKEDTAIAGEINNGVRYASIPYYLCEGFEKLELNKEENMEAKIKRDLIKMLFEKEFYSHEIDRMREYKGRIIFDYFHRSAKFIDFIDKLNEEYKIKGHEVAEIIIDEFDVEEYKEEE